VQRQVAAGRAEQRERQRRQHLLPQPPALLDEVGTHDREGPAREDVGGAAVVRPQGDGEEVAVGPVDRLREEGLGCPGGVHQHAEEQRLAGVGGGRSVGREEFLGQRQHARVVGLEAERLPRHPDVAAEGRLQLLEEGAGREGLRRAPRGRGAPGVGAPAARARTPIARAHQARPPVVTMPRWITRWAAKKAIATGARPTSDIGIR
jgi:hypothetical protein